MLPNVTGDFWLYLASFGMEMLHLCHSNKDGCILGYEPKRLEVPPFAKPYFWIENWMQARRLVSQTMRSKFLSSDRCGLVGK